jgi:hypothetical protein
MGYISINYKQFRHKSYESKDHLFPCIRVVLSFFCVAGRLFFYLIVRQGVCASEDLILVRTTSKAFNIYTILLWHAQLGLLLCLSHTQKKCNNHNVKRKAQIVSGCTFLTSVALFWSDRDKRKFQIQTFVPKSISLWLKFITIMWKK